MSELPLKKSSQGASIETRPAYVEDWLDTLPYVDFNKTSTLLSQALVATNKTDIKAGNRIELVELYNRPYQYYISSQIKTGAHHTLESITMMQSQVSMLKQIAINLSFACKLAVDSSLNKTTLWRQAVPPIEGMLMSMNYLSHALIFSFLEYTPMPKNVWQQLNGIYHFAEAMDSHRKVFKIFGENDSKIETTVDHSYKRILLASLVDPYHLPFGAIWEIYEQLDSWAEFAQVKPMQKQDDGTGYFVFDLRKDDKGVNYPKFSHENVSNQTRLLDATGLLRKVSQHVDQIEANRPVDSSLKLSPYFANALIRHMYKAWGLPQERQFPRQKAGGSLDIATGIGSVYYFFNNENAFILPGNPSDEADITENQFISTNSNLNHHAEDWRILDRSEHGYSAIRESKLKKPIRVGELVATRDKSTGSDWAISAVRWLMISKEIQKIGLQVIAESARPIALRATTGDARERTFRPAFLMNHNQDRSSLSVLAEKGLFEIGRTLEIERNGKYQKINVTDLIETGMTYEIFNFSSA